MADLETFGVLTECMDLSISLLYDEARCRPILQVSQSIGQGQRYTIRYAISPSASVPSWLIEDATATFLAALVDACRHTFGIQEELELRLPPTSCTACGQVSPTS